MQAEEVPASAEEDDEAGARSLVRNLPPPLGGEEGNLPRVVGGHAAQERVGPFAHGAEVPGRLRDPDVLAVALVGAEALQKVRPGKDEEGEAAGDVALVR